jgi:uncharacterized protein YlxW (UPF0749 family)
MTPPKKLAILNPEYLARHDAKEEKERKASETEAEIQTLRAKVTELEKEVESLKTRIADVENHVGL